MYKIYTLENCPNCEELKENLKINSIAYEEVNIEDDFLARAKMIENDLEDLPVVEQNGVFKSGSVQELLNQIVKSEVRG